MSANPEPKEFTAKDEVKAGLVRKLDFVPISFVGSTPGSVGQESKRKRVLLTQIPKSFG